MLLHVRILHMNRTGTAHLPLHGGKAPAYLFQRMTRLARELTLAIVQEYGVIEMMRRLSDPFWFQAFGCVLGYDWHSSGVTTVVCGALKEAWKPISKEMGLYIAGGKGATSRKTPSEIEALAPDLKISPCGLIYASRMSAKVDNNALQDGYQIYHHSFIFDREGRWAVIQQGMNEANGWARRYHWLSETVMDFVDEPHAAIITVEPTQPLNMIAHDSYAARAASVALALSKSRGGTWLNLRNYNTWNCQVIIRLAFAILIRTGSQRRCCLRTKPNPKILSSFSGLETWGQKRFGHWHSFLR